MSKRRLLIYTGIILVFIVFYVVFALLAPPGSIIPGLAGVVVFAGGFTLFVKWTDYYSDKKKNKSRQNHE